MKILISTALMILACFSLMGTASAQKMERLKQYDTPNAYVKVALNAYSFSNPLLNYVNGTEGDKLTLFDLIDFCAMHNIDALDPTGYFFLGYPKVPSDEYIYAIKRYAHLKGVDISGTGVRNNFANPNAADRAADVQLVKNWIDVAAKLGAPVIRVFAGDVPKGYENKWDEVASWIIEASKEVTAYGASKGVLVAIQNHGDMLKTADQTIKIVKAVDSPWFGVILDTGYFMTEDPYADIEKILPYTFNWQLKESPYGKDSEVRIDLARLMKIIKKSGYHGYLPIETLPAANKPYDPYTLVPAFINEAKAAVAAEFGN